MATEVIVTVKPSGGDYTSLVAAEVGEQRDLVALDEIATIECYAMVTGAVIFIGWTTSPTQYINVFVPESERHQGIWDESKFIIRDSAVDVFSTREASIRLTGAQIDYTGTGSVKSGYRIDSVSEGGDSYIEKCIIRDAGNGSTGSRGIHTRASSFDINIYAFNNLIYGFTGQGSLTESNLQFKWKYYNNTFYNNTVGLQVRPTHDIDIQNNAIFGNSDTDYHANIDEVDVNNCAADIDFGSSSQVLASANNYENEFTDVAGRDFSLTGSGVCHDKGVDDPASGLFSDDIIGTARGDWDIGAFEFDPTIAFIDNEKNYILTRRHEGISVYNDSSNWWVGT